MTRVAYYVAVFEEWISVAERLRDERNWQPVYFSTLTGNHAKSRHAFPDAVLHDKFDAIRSIAPPGKEWWLETTLDAEELAAHAEYYPAFMRMLDRLDMFGSFTFGDRQRHFLRQLSLWKGMSQELRPDVVVFSNTPHGPADYAMYATCRTLGIPTAVFSRTSVPRLCLLRDSIEGQCERVLDAYRSILAATDSDSVKLAATSEDYLANLRRDYRAAEPKYMRSEQGPASIESPRRLNAKRVVRAATRVWMWPRYLRALRRGEVGQARQITVPPLALQLKPNNAAYESSSITPSQWLQYAKDAKVYKRALREAYDELVTVGAAEYEQPYVYLPLHYQPEATTSPDAGAYVDQVLMVRLLAEALPAGWEVWVREHPSQFSDRLFGEQARTPQHYADFLAVPRVRMVDMAVNAFDLIDNAKAVATATGTADWEALVRGTWLRD